MLCRISVLSDKAETFDDGLPQGARADVVFHGLNEPEGERLTLFVERERTERRRSIWSFDTRTPLPDACVDAATGQGFAGLPSPHKRRLSAKAPVASAARASMI